MEEDEPSIEYVLDRYLLKENVQELCDDLDLPVSGNKADLIDSLLEDEDFDPDEAIAFLDKEQLQTLCDDWDLDDSGSRDALFERVSRAIKAASRRSRTPSEEVEAYPPRPSEFSSQPLARAPPPPPPPDGWLPPAPEPARPAPATEWIPPPPRPEYNLQAGVAPSAPVEYGSLPEESPRLKDVLEFLYSWRPSQPFRDEQRYKDTLLASISQKFGETSVRDEVPIHGGRIDLEVFYQIGIELKYPVNAGDLDRLHGQASKYRRHFGPNLIVILFTGGYSQRDVVTCARSLENQGIKVLLK